MKRRIFIICIFIILICSIISVSIYYLLKFESVDKTFDNSSSFNIEENQINNIGQNQINNIEENQIIDSDIVETKNEDDRNQIIKDYYETVENSRYIIHALGGMNESESYINSIDTLEIAYSAGYRLFEVDVSFTSDHVLVLAHSGENNVWSRNDWEKRLGQPYPLDPEYEESLEGYDMDKALATYKDFMSFKIQGKYRASDLNDLINFMDTHKDMYVMIDAGHRSYEDTLDYYKEIVKTAGDRTDVLDRMIAGGQTTDMVKAAREAYDFPIINLYYDSDDKREKILSTPEKFVSYCEDNNIISYSTSAETFNETVGKVLGASSLTGYVFTINSEADAEKCINDGADVIGTDYLWSN